MTTADDILAARNAARILRGEFWSAAMAILDALAEAISEKSGEPRAVVVLLEVAIVPSSTPQIVMRTGFNLHLPGGWYLFVEGTSEALQRLVDLKCIEKTRSGRYRISPVGLRLLATEMLEED